MLSQSNSVLVFVSPLTGFSLANSLANLEEGGIGWFDGNGAAVASGADSFLCTKRNGVIIKSVMSDVVDTSVNPFRAATGMVGVTGPVTAEVGYHELAITFDIPGMTGKYVKKGVYRAKTADTASDIANALVASFNAAMNREGSVLAVAAVTGAGTDEITVTASRQPYAVARKKGGFPTFSMNLYSPTGAGEAVLTPGIVGVGEGWWVYEKEEFAWGNQDAFRGNALRSAFESKHYASEALSYNLDAVVISSDGDPSNGSVKIKQTVYCAFNSAGTAPA